MRHISFFSIVLAAMLLTTSAYAGVGKVSNPEVNKDETEVEYSNRRYSDSRRNLNNRQRHAYEVEYGFTDQLMIGIEIISERESGKGHFISAYGLEAQYQLTQQGEWWLSSAVKGEYDHAAQNSGVDEAEIDLLAAYERGPGRLVGNLSFSREIGGGRAREVGIESALQALHQMEADFSAGLEWHAEYGALNNLGANNRTEHYVGPIVRGELLDTLDYTAGFYWGLTDASANQAARIQLGYEF